MNEKHRFQVSKWDTGSWVVIDTENGMQEMCVCGAYEEQLHTAEARARTIAGALNATDLLMKHMRGMN